jgi:hypothetical protein
MPVAMGPWDTVNAEETKRPGVSWRIPLYLAALASMRLALTCVANIINDRSMRRLHDDATGIFRKCTSLPCIPASGSATTLNLKNPIIGKWRLVIVIGLHGATSRVRTQCRHTCLNTCLSAKSVTSPPHRHASSFANSLCRPTHLFDCIHMFNCVHVSLKRTSRSEKMIGPSSRSRSLS